MTAEEFHERYLSATLKKPNLDKTKLERQHERPHMVRASHVPESVNWYEAGKVSDSID